MRKVTFCLLITLLVCSPLMIVGSSRDCLADAYWYDFVGKNPDWLSAYSDGGVPINLVITNGTVSGPLWALSHNIDNGSGWGGWNLLNGSGQGSENINGLNNNFKLDLKLSLGAMTLQLGGHYKGAGYDDAKVISIDQSTVTIKWDTYNDGIFDNKDKTTSVAMVGAVPIPPTAYLLASGLLGLVGFRRKLYG